METFSLNTLFAFYKQFVCFLFILPRENGEVLEDGRNCKGANECEILKISFINLRDGKFTG